MIALPPLVILGLTLLVYERFRLSAGLRSSMLIALLLTGAFIALATELLSAFRVLTSVSVGLSWLVFVAALGGYWIRYPTRLRPVWQEAKQRIQAFRQVLGLTTTLLLLGILGTIAVVALFSAPNNNDSLSYHLSRLGYWVQQHSVTHYASHSERATSFPPFSSFIHLHLYLLSGSAWWFQLVSWIALLGSLCAVSLITQRFSSSPRALRLAVLLAVTTPMTVLEAMTTQNDVLVGLWCLSLVWHGFRYLDQPTTFRLLLVALSVALGIVTKATFVFFVAPIGLGLAGVLFRKMGPGAALRLGSTVILAVALVNTPLWLRNYALYQSPIGHMCSGNQNRIHTLPALLSSTAKHGFMHLGFLSPGDRYNSFLRERLLDFHAVLGLDLDDPRLGMPFKLVKLNFSEDFAHNFLFAWLLVLSIGLLWRRSLPSALRWYALGVGAGFLLFCSLIGYQWYGARLQTPFFLLAAPVLGIVYGSLSGRIPSMMLRSALVLGVLPYLLFSTARPLVSTRWLCETIFPVLNERLALGLSIEGLSGLKRPSILMTPVTQQLWDDAVAESRALRQYLGTHPIRAVGFHFTEGSLDYAYQHTLRDLNVTFRHVLVENYSKVLEDSTFTPDCIISERSHDLLLWYRGKAYTRTWQGQRCALYVPADARVPPTESLSLARSPSDSLSTLRPERR